MDLVNIKEIDKKYLVNDLLKRSQLDYGNVQNIVDEILKDVKENGDVSLFKYTKKFDYPNISPNNFIVTQEEINEAYKLVSSDFLEIIKKSITRVSEFHSKQKKNSWITTEKNGEILGQVVRPVENCGVYVPGGKAAYPSSVIMNIIPATVAGVENIYMATPPDKEGKINPATLVCAKECGVKKIFKMGGAQSIAALAYGTETVPKVDKIVGPGNIYVALAKRSVFGYVSIDSVAGPSEILIIADQSANPQFVAADLLSQAEHDELASAILLTNSVELGNNVKKEIAKQVEKLNRKEITLKSLENYGKIIITKDLEEAIELCNLVAPEHMEICTNSPFELLPKIKNAGAIFLGHYTAEPLGDYMAGPNHVLPTGGTARFFSPLSVDDFTKTSSVLSFTKESMALIGESVVKFAEAEGLQGHANSVKVRLNEKLD
ncbi:MAG: histidinol dehydrogenase [Lachnospirales bacterium]